jgi:uncharacterized repeat protein (TIGR01451 family)/CSLREA domain-containing protein
LFIRSIDRVLVAAVVLALAALPALATTFTVTSTADTIAVDGVVTLREAITAANTNAPSGDAPAGTAGLDTINFNIPGAGVHTIVLSSDLPVIDEPVFLDGLSQLGAAPGTLLIQIQGGNNVIFLAGNLSSGSTVRGLVINGFTGTGIFMEGSSSNVITSNFVGTDPTGNAAPSPGPIGIDVSGLGGTASNNTVGGNTPSLGNLVVSTDAGIAVVALGGTVANTIVAGNRVGTNAAGTTLLAPSTMLGIIISGTTNTLIGGSTGTTPGAACSGACNLVVAPGGVFVDGPGGDTLTIEGNFIGTNLAGTVALASSIGQTGIGFTSPFPWVGSVMIGGTTAGARNLISGYTSGLGIDINSQNSPSTIVIAGNYIGVDTTGALKLPNLYGVEIESSNAVTIGGSVAGAGNVISGNSVAGVILQDASSIAVQSNVIGPAADGITAITGTPQFLGVLITQLAGASNNNIVGAQTSGGAGGNIIANNNYGVVVELGTGNSILSNSIFANTSSPIILGSVLVPIPNDPCDTDTGANNLQNWPALSSAILSGGQVTLTGNLNSAANTTFTVEVFSNPAGSSAQARTRILTTTLTTNASCNAPLNVILPAMPAGTIITATATDPNRNTSAVSNGVPVATMADLSITKTASAPLAFGGQNITYTLLVANAGPAAATSVVVTDVLPPGTTFVSATPAGSCTGTTTITCSVATLNSGASTTFTIVVKAPTAGGSVSNTATVTSALTDPNPANNSSTVILSISPASSIPTLSEIMLLMLAAMLALIAAYKLR